MASVSCPSCKATCRVKGDAPSGSITCKRCGTRFAVGEEPGEAHAKHSAGVAARRHRPSGSPVGLAIGLVVTAIGLVVMLLLVIGGREKPPTFKELQTRIGIQVDPRQVPFETDPSQLVQNAGPFDRSLTQGLYVYIYYSVQEGEAELILDRGPWENGRARIRQITLR